MDLQAGLFPAGQKSYQSFGITFTCAASSSGSGNGEPVCPGVVVLECGETPDELSGPSQKRGLLQTNGREFLIAIPGIARYHVTRSRIRITPHVTADEQTIRLFLQGSAMGALLHLRGILPLHGSAVRLPDGGALIFCGISTAGKSTLAAAMSLKGWPTMADDIAAVHFDSSGHPWLHPGLSRAKLWKDAFVKLSLKRGEPVRPGIEKFFHAGSDWREPELVRRIYEIVPENQSGPARRVKVEGLAALHAVQRNVFRPAMTGMLGPRRESVTQIAHLLQHVSFGTIERPLQGNTLDAMVQIVTEDWPSSD
jgi:hypothetical protein